MKSFFTPGPVDNKRTNSQEIVRGKSAVITKNHEDYNWLRIAEALVIDESQMLTGAGGSLTGSGGSLIGADGSGLNKVSPIVPKRTAPGLGGLLTVKVPIDKRFVEHKWAPKSVAYPIVLPDTPDLSDIKNVTFSTYYGADNVVKIKAVIKIKNSSVNKKSVSGVDARIYNPQGA